MTIKRMMLAAALATGLALPAMAGGHGGGQEISGFVGFGTFATAGQATAGSALGGQAEAFANGSAGVSFSRCTSCGGGSFSGFQTNEAGALTSGFGVAFGQSTGAAQGGALGGFVASRRR